MSECPIDPHKHHYAYCLPFGAHVTGAARETPRTRYRFWAPSRRKVQLEIYRDGAAPALTDMEHTSDGWFEAEAEGGAGTRYRFRVART